jgi:hypothetical protein
LAILDRERPLHVYPPACGCFRRRGNVFAPSSALDRSLKEDTTAKVRSRAVSNVRDLEHPG